MYRSDVGTVLQDGTKGIRKRSAKARSLVQAVGQIRWRERQLLQQAPRSQLGC